MCVVAINVLWLFLTVPKVGLQCVFVVFPDHTHLFFFSIMFTETLAKYNKCTRVWIKGIQILGVEYDNYTTE